MDLLALYLLDLLLYMLLAPGCQSRKNFRASRTNAKSKSGYSYYKYTTGNVLYLTFYLLVFKK